MLVGSLDYEYLTTNETALDFFLDDDVRTAYRVFTIVTFTYIPFILVTNSLVFWATILCTHFHTPINILLFSLSIADLCMGVVGIPMYNLSYMDNTQHIIIDNKYACLALFAFGWVSAGGSLINLTCIAIDRYIAVMWPTKYRSMATSKTAIGVVIVIWIYILFIAFLPMMGWNNYDKDISGARRCNYYITFPKIYVFVWGLGTMYLCIIIPCILFVHMYITFSRQVKTFKVHSRLMTREQISQFKDRASSVKITIALMFMFIILWLPYLLIAPFKYFQLFSPTKIEILKVISHMLLDANAFVNAPIYAIGKKDYRYVYWLMLTTPPWAWKEVLRNWHCHVTSNMQWTSNVISVTLPVVEKDMSDSENNQNVKAPLKLTPR